MSAPLTGITVLDLTRGLSGPFCTMTLAEMGATVIKVERPGEGDEARALPPFKDARSASFAGVNRGKKSIALDLEEDADRALFERLLARADVLAENFRPGVTDRLGYGWNDLHAALPGLIYAALSGFGQTGPEKARPAYDTLVQARGGVMSITGEAGRAPVRVGAAIGDIVAGLFLAQGVLAALLDRTRTGKGRMIDVSMLDSQLAILGQAVATASVGARAPAPAGTRHPSVAPSESFEAADGPFVIAAGNDALFEKLCIALDLPLTGDARFGTNAARCRHVRLLKRLIESATIERPRAHWIAKLEAAGIPAGPIQTVEQVITDPQIVARNMIVDVLDKNGRAAFKAAGNPVKMTDAADPTARPPAPELDANRGEILRWLDGE